MRNFVNLVFLTTSVILATEFHWFQAPNAPWSGRGLHATVVFRDTIWLIGGVVWDSASGRYIGSSEIWCSPNGRDWMLITDSAPWGGIRGHTLTVHNDALYLIGGLIYPVAGSDTGIINRKAWRSTDGRHWNVVCDSTPFRVRYHTAISYRGFLWVLGGSQGIRVSNFTNKIWRSADGREWILANENPSWAPRCSHTTTLFRDSLWLIGGELGAGDSFYIWRSADGVTWFGLFPRPGWYYADHVSLEFYNKLWVIGGNDCWKPTRSVWFSDDGHNWTFLDSAPWPRRACHTGVILRDTLWIFGGYCETLCFNDVWYLAETSGGVSEKKTSVIQINVSTPTIIHLSQLSQFFQQLRQPAILFNTSGQKIDLNSANPIRHLKPGLYFLLPQRETDFNTQGRKTQKIILIN